MQGPVLKNIMGTTVGVRADQVTDAERKLNKDADNYVEYHEVPNKDQWAGMVDRVNQRAISDMTSFGKLAKSGQAIAEYGVPVAGALAKTVAKVPGAAAAVAVAEEAAQGAAYGEDFSSVTTMGNKVARVGYEAGVSAVVVGAAIKAGAVGAAAGFAVGGPVGATVGGAVGTVGTAVLGKAAADAVKDQAVYAGYELYDNLIGSN